jgi:hypothetical protein
VRRALILLAALGAWALGGCSSVMWYGKTPDREVDVRVVADGDGQRLVVGEHEGDAFEAIALETLTFADDGRVAHAAKHHGGWSVVANGRVLGPPRARVSWVGWSASGDVIAVVGDAQGDRVVTVRDHGGRPVESLGPLVDAVAQGSVVSTTTGHRAFVGFDGRTSRVFVDDVPGPPWDGIAALHLAQDGHPSYLARRNAETWVVRRGMAQGPHEDVAELIASSDGTRTVAVVRREDGWVVDDGRWRSRPFDIIGDLADSPRGPVFRAEDARGAWACQGDAELGPYLAVRAGSLRTSTTGALAFVARDVQGERVVADGVPLPAWTEVTELVWSGARQVAYVARDLGAVHVVRGTDVGPAYRAARDLRVGAKGLLFVARIADRDVVVANGTQHDAVGIVPGTLRLASDGVTWGAIAEGADGFEIVRPSGCRSAIDLEEVVGEVLRRRAPDAVERIVTELLERELERTVRGHPPTCTR